MTRKPNFTNVNVPILKRICAKYGYEIEQLNPDQYRIYGATHVIDIWPARMVYHRINGENISSDEPYNHGLKWQINETQVAYLLATGEYRKA